MEWFLYDNGLRHERVNFHSLWNRLKSFEIIRKSFQKSFNIKGETWRRLLDLDLWKTFKYKTRYKNSDFVNLNNSNTLPYGDMQG